MAWKCPVCDRSTSGKAPKRRDEGEVHQGEACGECEKNAARIYCLECERVTMLMPPGPMEGGYVVRPSSTVHSESCHRCKPSVKSHTIIEQETWRRSVN